tara:strand:+ start:883 stop:1275 length:393 start_codon:yes stop_codon:yes gene_type:complete
MLTEKTIKMVTNFKHKINNKRNKIKYYLKTKLGYELSPLEEFNKEDIEHIEKYDQSLYLDEHPKYSLERCFKENFFRKIPKNELIDLCMGFKPNTYPSKRFKELIKKYDCNSLDGKSLKDLIETDNPNKE